MSSGQEAPSGQKVSWQAGDSQHAAEPRKQPIAHRGRSVTNSKSLELGCCASSQGKGRQRTASLANASDGSPGVTPRRPGLRKGSIESNASTPRARSTCAPARKSQHPLEAGGPGQAFARRALRARGEGRGLVRTGSFSELRDRVGQRACQARVCRARVSSSLPPTCTGSESGPGLWLGSEFAISSAAIPSQQSIKSARFSSESPCEVQTGPPTPLPPPHPPKQATHSAVSTMPDR